MADTLGIGAWGGARSCGTGLCRYLIRLVYEHVHMQVYRHVCSSGHLCIDMCIHMCIHMCIDMGIDICIDMCIGMWTDMCFDTCTAY